MTKIGGEPPRPQVPSEAKAPPSERTSARRTADAPGNAASPAAPPAPAPARDRFETVDAHREQIRRMTASDLPAPTRTPSAPAATESGAPSADAPAVTTGSELTAGEEERGGRAGGSVTLRHRASGDFSERTRSATVGTDRHGGVTAGVEASSQIGDQSVHESQRAHQTATIGARWTGDRAEVRHGRESVEHHEQGTRAASHETTVSAGREGVTVAHQRTRERDVPDGSGDRRRQTVGGAADLGEGRLTGTRDRSRRDADGEERSGVGGRAGLDFDRHGRLEGAEIGVEGRWRHARMAPDGRYRVTVSEPAPVREQGRTVGYQVDWRRELSGSLTVGGEGQRAGASVGGSAERIESGRAVFPTREEALRFADQAHTRVGDRADAVETAAGALRMPVGESVTRRTGGGLEGEVNASAIGGFLGIGADAGGSRASEMTVTRGRAGDRDYVDVRVGSEESHRLGGSVSGPGVSEGASMGSGTRDARTTRFWVGTPEGNRAYEALLQGRELPRGGWERRGSERATSDTEGANVGMAGISAEASSQVEHIRQRDAQGRLTVEERGSEDRAVHIPGGDYLRAHTELRAVDPAGGGRWYTLTTRVQSSEGSSTEASLARAAGVGESGREDVPSSGHWTMSQHVTQEEMDRFVSRLREQPPQMETLRTLLGGDDLLDLQRRLRESRPGDRAAEARAVAEYISETGADGMGYFRSVTNAPLRTDLRLAGDPNFQGTQWRRDVEGRIEGYRGALTGEARGPDEPPAPDRFQTRRQIEAEISGLRNRLYALEDRYRYQDLPAALRNEEIDRTRRWMQELEALQQIRPRGPRLADD